MIKKDCLTVGYNTAGQEFFDLLQTYHPYINSYFFSALHGQEFWDKFDPDSFIKDLEAVNTYNLKGNILFNYKRDEEDFDFLQGLVSRILDGGKINLTQITVATPQTCEKIRKLFPQLEIHLSVHYSKNYDLKDCIGLCDCVNLSSVFEFNVFDKIKFLKDNNVKVKYILNKGCFPNREMNYKHFEDTKEISCELCNRSCFKLIEKYPWLKLARIFYYLEMIEKFYPMVDLWKLTTRETPTKDIVPILQYLILQKRTKFIEGVDITPHYQEFLDWISERVLCDNLCYKCGICKKYWEIFSGNKK